MTCVPIALDVHLPFAAQVCCAISMTPASATPATRAPTATPTPSTAKPSARVLRGTWDRPATRMWTSAHWVSTGAELASAAEEQLGKAPGQLGACPVSCTCVLQEPTLASTQGNASTPRGPSSASACRATQALAARSTSTSASPTPARTMPPVWTRLGSSSASACPVGGQPHGPLPQCWVQAVGGLWVPLSFSSVLVWVRSHGSCVCLGTAPKRKSLVKIAWSPAVVWGREVRVGHHQPCSGLLLLPTLLVWIKPRAGRSGVDNHGAAYASGPTTCSTAPELPL